MDKYKITDIIDNEYVFYRQYNNFIGQIGYWESNEKFKFDNKIQYRGYGRNGFGDIFDCPYEDHETIEKCFILSRI